MAVRAIRRGPLTRSTRFTHTPHTPSLPLSCFSSLSHNRDNRGNAAQGTRMGMPPTHRGICSLASRPSTLAGSARVAHGKRTIVQCFCPHDTRSKSHTRKGSAWVPPLDECLGGLRRAHSVACNTRQATVTCDRAHPALVTDTRTALHVFSRSSVFLPLPFSFSFSQTASLSSTLCQEARTELGQCPGLPVQAETLFFFLFLFFFCLSSVSVREVGLVSRPLAGIFSNPSVFIDASKLRDSSTQECFPALASGDWLSHLCVASLERLSAPPAWTLRVLHTDRAPLALTHTHTPKFLTDPLAHTDTLCFSRTQCSHFSAWPHRAMLTVMVPPC